jgi:hypothetical protein
MDNVYDAQEASQAAIDRQPLDSDWGFCAYGGAPGGIGGGYSAFYWFESREKMLGFIAEHALFMNLLGETLTLLRSRKPSTRSLRQCGAAGFATRLHCPGLTNFCGTPPNSHGSARSDRCDKAR